MKQKRLLSWLKISVIISLCVLFAFQSSAYTLLGEVHKVNNQLDYVNVNTGAPYSSSTSYADRLSIYLDNSDPQLFQDEHHYTFDVVMGIDCGRMLPGTSYNLYNAYKDLHDNGFTDSWFAHYVWGFDGYLQYDDNSLHDLTTAEWTVYKDECYIAYMSDDATNPGLVTWGNGQLNFPGLNLPSRHLYIQIKVHFNFTVEGNVIGFKFNWHNYPFYNSQSGNMQQQYSVYLDTSAIISEDMSDLAVIMRNMGIMNDNILSLGADIQDLQFQMTGLTSTLDELLDYIQQWNLLLFRNIPSNHLGIYYTLLEDLDVCIDELTTIRSGVITIRTNVINIRNNTDTLVTTTNSINATTSLIYNLLNSRSGNFWSFLDSDFDLIHDDLIDLYDYLSQSTGDDVSDEQGQIDQASASLVSIQGESGSPSASDYESLSDDFTISSDAANIFGFIYTNLFHSIIGIFVIGAAVYFLLKQVWERILQ